MILLYMNICGIEVPTWIHFCPNLLLPLQQLLTYNSLGVLLLPMLINLILLLYHHDNLNLLAVIRYLQVHPIHQNARQNLGMYNCFHYHDVLQFKLIHCIKYFNILKHCFIFWYDATFRIFKILNLIVLWHKKKKTIIKLCIYTQ